MKKLILITIILFTFLSIISANTQDIKSVNIIPDVTTVYKYKSVSGQYIYAYSNITALGRYNGRKSFNEEKFRIILRIDLSDIPNNALITDVNFLTSFTADTSHLSYSIKSFNYNLSGASDEWNGAGSSYRSTDSTNGSDPWFNYTNSSDESFLTAIDKCFRG